jgi:hypothetical protein
LVTISDIEIWVAQGGRGAGTGHVDGGKPSLLDQFCGDAVIGAGRHDHAVPAQQCAKAVRLRHLSHLEGWLTLC